MDLCELKNRYEIELLSAIDTRQAFLNVPFQRVFNDAHQEYNNWKMVMIKTNMSHYLLNMDKAIAQRDEKIKEALSPAVAMTSKIEELRKVIQETTFLLQNERNKQVPARCRGPAPVPARVLLEVHVPIRVPIPVPVPERVSVPAPVPARVLFEAQVPTTIPARVPDKNSSFFGAQIPLY
jgi:hypothetical protein